MTDRRSPEDDLERELQAHLDLEAEDRREVGDSPDEARHAALRAFGNRTLVKEQIREMSPWTGLEQLAQDVRYALRTLRRNPGFTLVAGLSLALGIGGNAAMFSLVSGVLLRPLPYPESERLVRVTGYYPQGALVALLERSRTLETAGYTADSMLNLKAQGAARRLAGSSVSANLFSLLRVPAALGRTFEPGEDQPGRDGVVVLSHSLWQSEFGLDPRVVGRVVRVEGRDRQVVGVMPPQFAFPGSGTQLWIPLHLDPANTSEHWGSGFMPLVARLRPASTLDQARGEIRPLVAQIVPLFPFPMARDWNADAAIVPLHEDTVAGARAKLLVLVGAVGVVLLIACVNVAALLLSQATVRRKELALRAALGAGRGRMVRQLLTESVVLAAGGGALGIGLALGALAQLKSALPMGIPRLAEIAIDGRVLAAVTLLAVATGIAFGVIPALRATRFDLAQAVKASAQRSPERSNVGLRNSLIVGEVGLAVVLVAAAGLLIKSLWLLSSVDPGFRPDRVFGLRVSPSQSSCLDRATCIAFYDRLLLRVHGLTGVTDVAAANFLPLTGEVPAVPVEIEGRPLKPAEELAPLLWAGAVTPDYFRIMGIPVLQGRAFTNADGEKASKVVLVSAGTARDFWPGQDAIGKQLRVVWELEARTVVGVVGDVRQYDLSGRSPSWIDGVVYMPYPQAVTTTRQVPAAMSLLLRTAGPPAGLAAEVRQLVASLDPNVPVGEIQPLDAVVAASTVNSRSLVVVFAVFGATAIVLAAIGIYGVVSYSTTQRTYEFGVRMALGATRRSVLGLALGQSLRLTLVGLALGTLAALALTRSLAAFLYEVTATDPTTFLAVALLLLAVALLAGLVPAGRAASIDPKTALRAD